MGTSQNDLGRAAFHDASLRLGQIDHGISLLGNPIPEFPEQAAGDVVDIAPQLHNKGVSSKTIATLREGDTSEEICKPSLRLYFSTERHQ